MCERHNCALNASSTTTPVAAVYFITDGRAIKIGYASDVRKRFHCLQTGSASELVVLATIYGTRRIEGLIHQHFADAYLRGEWYEPAPALLAFIKVLVSHPIGINEGALASSGLTVTRRLDQLLDQPR